MSLKRRLLALEDRIGRRRVKFLVVRDEDQAAEAGAALIAVPGADRFDWLVVLIRMPRNRHEPPDDIRATVADLVARA